MSLQGTSRRRADRGAPDSDLTPSRRSHGYDPGLFAYAPSRTEHLLRVGSWLARMQLQHLASKVGPRAELALPWDSIVASSSYHDKHVAVVPVRPKIRGTGEIAMLRNAMRWWHFAMPVEVRGRERPWATTSVWVISLAQVASHAVWSQSSMKIAEWCCMTCARLSQVMEVYSMVLSKRKQ